MTRVWHYLHRSRSAGWPKQQTVLALDYGARTPIPGSNHSYCAALLGWAAETWTGQGGNVDRQHAASGRDAADWWQYLRCVGRKGLCHWVWIEGACHALAVLGFWDRLDLGLARLAGATGRGNAERVDGNGNNGAELFVVADTPTCVLAVCGVNEGTVLVLDPGNVGVVYSGAGGGRDDRCSGGSTDDGGDSVRPRSGAAERASGLRGGLLACQQLASALRLGGLRMTTAAQAWHGWRHSYLGSVVEVHNDIRRLNAERDSCYGGRCEVYRLGLVAGKVFELDAAAHYPACAADNQLPVRPICGPDRSSWASDRAVSSGLLVIARGEVRTEVPCLPYRHNGATVYPVGMWRGTYCWPEIELLRSEGGRFREEESWVYEGGSPCADFMRTLWQRRLDAERRGNGWEATACKGLSNSLVGRIGALGRAWVNAPNDFFPRRWAGWYAPSPEDGLAVRWRSMAGRVEYERISGWGGESVPALAAWVYSLGRVRLWKWLQAAGADNIFYADTDCLFTNAVGARRIEEAGMLRPGVLGGLRVKAVHPWARFSGVKHYETPNGLTWAGRPDNAIDDGGDGFSYVYPEKPGESARNGRAPDGRLITVEVPSVRAYRGGKIGADGCTMPLEVWDYG